MDGTWSEPAVYQSYLGYDPTVASYWYTWTSAVSDFNETTPQSIQLTTNSTGPLYYHPSANSMGVSCSSLPNGGGSTTSTAYDLVNMNGTMHGTEKYTCSPQFPYVNYAFAHAGKTGVNLHSARWRPPVASPWSPVLAISQTQFGRGSALEFRVNLQRSLAHSSMRVYIVDVSTNAQVATCDTVTVTVASAGGFQCAASISVFSDGAHTYRAIVSAASDRNVAVQATSADVRAPMAADVEGSQGSVPSGWTEWAVSRAYLFYDATVASNWYAWTGDVIAFDAALPQSVNLETRSSGPLYYHPAANSMGVSCSSQPGGTGSVSTTNLDLVNMNGVLQSTQKYTCSPDRPYVNYAFARAGTLGVDWHNAYWYPPGHALRPGGPALPGETAGGSNPALACSAACDGDPINTQTGEFWKSVADLTIAGPGAQLGVERTFSTTLREQDGPFGFGWSSSWGMRLLAGGSSADATLSTANHIEVHQENGATTAFTRLVNGSFTAPARVLATLTPRGKVSHFRLRTQRPTSRRSPSRPAFACR
jgi:hypothetical protein